MDRFIVKESQVSSNNHILDQSPALDSNVDNDPRDGDPQTENNVGVEEVPIGSTNIEMDGNGDPQILVAQILVAQTLRWMIIIMAILFSLIYLIQDIGIHLILNILIFWHKRVLKEIYQFRKVLEVDILEGFLHYFTIETTKWRVL